MASMKASLRSIDEAVVLQYYEAMLYQEMMVAYLRYR